MLSGRPLPSPPVSALRPTWNVRAPEGILLTVEYDTLRRRWRVDPGGYERRRLPDALAQATGSTAAAAWIVEVANRLDRHPGSG